MSTISVCFIVRNEEANLPRALRSVPASFEVIVGDTGSTDGTKAIAKASGAKVYDTPWNDNFAEARNRTAEHATGKYILFLDADEELYAGTEKVLDIFISKHPNQAGAVFIRNLIDGEVHVHQMGRFYPNNGDYRYAGAIHETIYKGDRPAACLKTGVSVTHHGYQTDEYESKGKAERYLTLYEKYLNQHPDDGYMLYQLGKLHFSLKNYPAASDVLLRCLELQQQNQLYYPVMLVMLGYTLQYLGGSSVAEELLTPYVGQFPEFPDLPFLLGLLAMDTGKLSEIERYFLMALSMGDTDTYTSVYGTGSFKAAYNLGVFYEISGRSELAFRYYREAAKLGYELAKGRLQILNKHI